MTWHQFNEVKLRGYLGRGIGVWDGSPEPGTRVQTDTVCGEQDVRLAKL